MYRSGTGNYSVGLNTGSSFASAVSWGSGQGSDLRYADFSSNTSLTSHDLIDVTGDSWLDDVYRSGSGNYIVRRNTGSGFGAEEDWGEGLSNTTYIRNASDWSGSRLTFSDLADLEGDGLVEALSRPDYGPFIIYVSYYWDGYWGFLPYEMDWGGDAVGAGVRWAEDPGGGVRLTNNLIDINGDRYLDVVGRINSVSYTIQLNTGTGFYACIDGIYPSTCTREWRGRTGTGLQEWTISSGTHVWHDLIDMNGDGLPDEVARSGANTYSVWLNTGSGFASTVQDWGTGQSTDIRYETAGLATRHDLLDMNGDGAPDDVYCDGTNPCQVRLNNAAKSDLLTAVTLPTGGSLAYGYTHINQAGGVSMWVASSITANDGLGGSVPASYSYAGGLYQGYPINEFRGFQTVTVTDASGAYHVTTFKQDDIYKGLVESQKSCAAGSPCTAGNGLLGKTDNTYNYTTIKETEPKIWFRYLQSSQSSTYEGKITPKQTRVDYTYDAYGNVLTAYNYGDVAAANDESRTTNEYAYNTTAWIVNKVKHTTTEGFKPGDASLTKYREAWAYYDNQAYGTVTLGNLTKTEAWLSGGTNVVNTLEYDSYGNVAKTKDGRANAGDYAGYTSQITYDSTYHTYPISVKDAKNNETKSCYYGLTVDSCTAANTSDKPYGALEKVTDPNSQVTTYLYDTFGRVTKVVRPGDSSASPTTAYTYYLDGVAPEYTLVQARETAGGGTLDSYTYVDGLGRTIQAKSEAQTTGQWVTAGSYYDTRGLVQRQSVPYTTTVASYTAETMWRVVKAWEFASTTEGWSAINNMSGFGWQSGGYVGASITGGDPYMHSGASLGVDITNAKIIKVRLKNSTPSTTGQIFFLTNADQTWNGAKHKDFAIVANSDYTEYTLDMSSVAGWTGTLYQLRLDPEAGAASGSFSVDSIRIMYPVRTPAWEFASDTEGWTAGYHMSGFGWQSGGYVGASITGGDPQMLSGDNLGVDISNAKLITVRLKNSTPSTTGQIYFITNADQTWNGAKHKDFAITASSDYTQYTIDMSSVAGWSGTLKQLRLDPEVGAASGSFSVDSIRIIGAPQTSYTYDALGRATQTTAPDGTSSTLIYGQWVITSTNALNQQKITKSNAYGQIVEVDEKNGGSTYVTTYQYNSGTGELVKITDAKTNQWTFTYDTLGRKTSMTDPDMGTWNYTAYDANGNLKTQTDAKNQTINLAYDELNRLTSKSYPSGNPDVYTYDTAGSGEYNTGRLVKAEQTGVYQREWGYDERGRAKYEKLTMDGKVWKTSFAYDSLDRVTATTLPGGYAGEAGEVVNTTYTAQGLPATVTSTLGIYLSSANYNAWGRLVDQTYGNNVKTSYDYYDTSGELDSEANVYYSYGLKNLLVKTNGGSGPTLMDLTYKYDQVSNVKAIDDQTPDNQDQSFGYDPLNRLTSATASGTYGSKTYSYNEIGNIITKDGRPSYTYSGNTHRVTYDGANYYCYDANGNIIQRATGGTSCPTVNLAFTYNYNNMPTAIGSETYTYQGETRLKKVSGNVTTYYINASYEEEWTDSTCTNPGVPGAPTFSNVTASSLTVNWTDVANEVGYQVQRCQGSGCTTFVNIGSQLAAGTTSYSDSGLTASTTYRYRIVAKAASGCAEQTGASSADVPTAANTNLALNKTVVASLGLAGGSLGACVNGGFWDANNASAQSTILATSSQYTSQWIKVDLGATYSINQIVYDNRYYNGGQFGVTTIYQVTFDIQVSTDGSTWTTVVSRGGQTSAQKYTFDLTPVNARYVRVTNVTPKYTSNSAWHCVYATEIQVYGSGGASAPRGYGFASLGQPHAGGGPALPWLLGVCLIALAMVIVPARRNVIARLAACQIHRPLQLAARVTLAVVVLAISVGVFDPLPAQAVPLAGHADTSANPVNRLASPNRTNVIKHYFVNGQMIATRDTPEGLKFNHTDHLGSASKTTCGDTTCGAIGAEVRTIRYDPWGTTQSAWGSGSKTVKYTYTGKEQDTTGLYYYGARYYDPALGRFITPDTIVPNAGDPQSLNRYAYTRNNPVRLVDPSGHYFGESAVNWANNNIVQPITNAFSKDTPPPQKMPDDSTRIMTADQTPPMPTGPVTDQGKAEHYLSTGTSAVYSRPTKGQDISSYDPYNSVSIPKETSGGGQASFPVAPGAVFTLDKDGIGAKYEAGPVSYSPGEDTTTYSLPLGVFSYDATYYNNQLISDKTSLGLGLNFDWSRDYLDPNRLSSTEFSASAGLVVRGTGIRGDWTFFDQTKTVSDYGMTAVQNGWYWPGGQSEHVQVLGGGNWNNAILATSSSNGSGSGNMATSRSGGIDWLPCY